MTKMPTKRELDNETRGWLTKGVIPFKAAETRRSMATQFPALADWHNAFADEWDRIAAKFPEKVQLAYRLQRDYAISCLANHEPGSELAQYWQDEATKWDLLLGEER